MKNFYIYNNSFYGSLKSLKPLTKLENVSISGNKQITGSLRYLQGCSDLGSMNNSHRDTQIELDYEYLPSQVHLGVLDDLKPFNYSLENWQLAHPEKMLVAQPKLFTNPDSKDKWIVALDKKVGQAQREILMTKLSKETKTSSIQSDEEEEEDHPDFSQTTTIPKSRAEKESIILELLKELQEIDKQESKSTSYHLKNDRFTKVTAERYLCLQEQSPKN